MYRQGSDPGSSTISSTELTILSLIFLTCKMEMLDVSSIYLIEQLQG